MGVKRIDRKEVIRERWVLLLGYKKVKKEREVLRKWDKNGRGCC